jgi:hypothetical protein
MYDENLPSDWSWEFAIFIVAVATVGVIVILNCN